MVQVHIKDSTSVVASGETIAGPGTFDTDELQVGGETYDNGVVIVTAGAGQVVLPMHPGHMLALPYALALFIIAGALAGYGMGRRLVLVLAFLLVAGHAQAWEGFKATNNVVNPGPDSKTYRASVYAAIVNEGEPYAYAPAGGFTVPSIGYGGAGTLWIGIREKLGGTVLATTEIGSVAITADGGGTAYDVPWPQFDRTQETSTTFTRVWRRNSPFPQATWNESGFGSVAWTEGTTGTTYERGGLVNSNDFELAPGASMALEVTQEFPFYLVVEELKQVASPDGGIGYGFEEIDETTSTEHTEGATPPQVVIEPAAPDYDMDDPTPAERPSSVTDIATLNDAQEARATDETELLKQVRDAVTQQTSVTSAGLSDLKKALAGTGGPDDGQGLGETAEEQETAVTEANEASEERGEDLMTVVGDLQDTIGAIGEKFQVSISGAEYPVLRVPMPPALGMGEYYTFNFANYAWVWTLIRYAILLTLGWYSLQNILSIIRSAVA